MTLRNRLVRLCTLTQAANVVRGDVSPDLLRRRQSELHESLNTELGPMLLEADRIETLENERDKWMGHHTAEVRAKDEWCRRALVAEKRVEELQTSLLKECETICAAESKLETMRKALEWYANPANNGPRTYRDGRGDTMHARHADVPLWMPIDDDKGEVAREALGMTATPGTAAAAVNPGSLPG